MKSIKINKKIITLLIALLLAFGFKFDEDISEFINVLLYPKVSYAMENLPIYYGEDYILIDENEPKFTDEEKNSEVFEKYSELDYLGRCGVAFAKLGIESMPNEERESIGMIKPSGWQTKKYNIVDGQYLYNRCHLIGFQLSGENANEENLITCTRYMNAGVMLEFENKVANYIEETNNHVLYRVTPMFENENLVANGVQIEALSIEDNGKGIKFNVYIYNVQPGIEIDYKTGKSYLID
ncbi:MAG: DNA/RNA non-specific endonuclease [Bacilli bacterium]|nr:DNA/RNA non-specific endonuclease [Bacilli bacterium]